MSFTSDQKRTTFMFRKKRIGYKFKTVDNDRAFVNQFIAASNCPLLCLDGVVGASYQIQLNASSENEFFMFPFNLILKAFF